MDRVLGLVEGREHSIAMHMQFAPVALAHRGEGGLVLAHGSCHPLAFTSWTTQALPSGSLKLMNEL